MDKGNKLVTKIKNAYRFMQMKKNDGTDINLVQEWAEKEREITALLEDFNWGRALHELVNFFWHRFCDFYIEKAKKENISKTLETVFRQMLPWFKIFLPSMAI
jgi:valyl-tRNA synthetase